MSRLNKIRPARRYRKAGLALWGLTVLLLVLGGCAPRLPTVWPGDELQPLPEPAEIPHGEGRIWQVDKAGQEPSYLFGTIHVSNPEVFDLPEEAEQAFAKARYAAFETDMTEPGEDVKEAYFELPEGTRLYDVLGEETYRSMKALALFRLFRIERLDRLQPWVVWMFVGGREISVDIRREEGEPVLDDWLHSRAIEDGKEVVSLETAQQQWDIFAGMPMEDQVSMLRTAIDDYGGPRTRVERIQLYLEGKLAVRYALWQRFLSNMKPDVAERFNERLVTGRNRSMTAQLLHLFAKGSTFVAVGAMHMPGEEGILRLLEQQGYRVTRLH